MISHATVMIAAGDSSEIPSMRAATPVFCRTCPNAPPADVIRMIVPPLARAAPTDSESCCRVMPRVRIRVTIAMIAEMISAIFLSPNVSTACCIELPGINTPAFFSVENRVPPPIRRTGRMIGRTDNQNGGSCDSSRCASSSRSFIENSADSLSGSFHRLLANHAA